MAIHLMCPSGKALGLSRCAVFSLAAGSGGFWSRLEDVVPEARG